jgi:hypothetical protein
MADEIQIPKALWGEMMESINSRLKKGSLDKPIVFALYTKEDDHHEVIDYKEITTVEVKGKYPDDYTYNYPGITEMKFYSHKGAGKWFSGTLVVGDGTDLDEEDKKWMVKEQLDFRVKMDRTSQGDLSYRAYFIDFPVVPLNLT